MSRGGRAAGRGRGARLKGPDITCIDDQPAPQSSKPEPLFPDIDLPVPKPRTEEEIERVDHYLSFRDRVRNGPLFAVLQLSSFTDDHGKINPRAGFDPFTGVERYSSRFYKPKRTEPDLHGQTFHLDFLPRELWSTVDPHKKDPIWKTLPASSTAQKRRHRVFADVDADDAKDDEVEVRASEDGAEVDESEDSDAPIVLHRRGRPSQSVKRRKKNDDPMTRQSGQKRGLEAEDELPDVDQNEEEEDEGEDPAQDSDFEEESDDDANDYNAENYFDTGEGDDYEDGGGGGGGDDAYD